MQRNPSLGRSLRPRPPKDLRPPVKEDSNLGGDLMGVNLKRLTCVFLCRFYTKIIKILLRGSDAIRIFLSNHLSL